jgi:YidC/Oxa1 family membrane protein insertase
MLLITETLSKWCRPYKEFRRGVKNILLWINTDFDLVLYLERSGDKIYLQDTWTKLKQFYDADLSSGSFVLGYLSSDEQDQWLKSSGPSVHTLFVGFGWLRTFIFRVMKARLILMTMPDLNQFHVKKSAAYPSRYVYFFHSLCSAHRIYRKNAFSAYDYIFCPTPRHQDELIFLESVEESKAKTKVVTGYEYLDRVVSRSVRGGGISQESRRNLLLAPTWGPQSISERCLESWLAILCSSKFYVAYRPHPMTLQRFPDHLDRIASQFKELHLDVNQDPSSSIEMADVIITDWSGIAFEYALAYLRPVAFIDTPYKVNNPGWSSVPLDPLEETWRDTMGIVFKENPEADVLSRLDGLVREQDLWKKKLESLRETLFPKLGMASESQAECIIQWLKDNH